MDNKIFGSTFLAVFSIAMLLFGVANVGAAAVDRWVFPTEEFGDYTYIGNTDVSNMKVASAMAKVSQSAEAWRESAELSVTYQDATAKYPLDNAEVSIEETAAQAQSGVQNNFVFRLKEETTAVFLAQQFPVTEFSPAEVEQVTTKLEQALQSGAAQTHVMISDDSLGVERVKVAEVVFPLQSKSESAATVIAALHSIQIAPGEKFSFLESINELDIIDVTDAELTEIASAIYTAILKTNFTIEKRSIGTSVPEDVPIGQEATINRSLGIDLVFSNPNASSFTLETAIEGDSLEVALTGFPFVYDYAVQISGKETVKPRLIKQFSAFVSNGKEIKEEGSEGIRIRVLRSVLSKGEELKIETISTDFYPPVNRVEILPLTAALPENAPAASVAASGSDGSPNNTSSSEEVTKEGNQVTADVSEEAADAVSPDSGSATAGENKDVSTDSNTDHGAEDETEINEPIYDKGGNRVNP